MLLNALLDLEASPRKQYFFKVDTDVVLFPERLLHFLRTLEAAAGTAQPLYIGKQIPPFMQARRKLRRALPGSSLEARRRGRER